MPTYTPLLDSADLLDWQALRDSGVDWKGLLLGNGASMAVSETFRYESLFQIASSGQVAAPLGAGDHALFDAFQTTNFELVLGGLKVAGVVCEATGQDISVIRTRYDAVQLALFQAIGPTHVSWDRVAANSLAPMRQELERYEFVYSTNYALLVYWAVMFEHDNGDGFKDFFWDPTTASIRQIRAFPADQHACSTFTAAYTYDTCRPV